jgi:hypothetical protein
MENKEDKKFRYTPFGVMVDEEGAYKDFDQDSFLDDVLYSSEKETYKKLKEDFIKNPEAKKSVAQVLKSGVKFIPWAVPVYSTVRRLTAGSQQMLASNTWAWSPEDVPGFLSLVDKLIQKYENVLGDDKVIDGLQAAKRRVMELNNSGAEVGGQKPTQPVQSAVGPGTPAYDQYVQMLVSKGIDENTAREQANAFVAQVEQSAGNLAGAMVNPEDSQGGSMLSSSTEKQPITSAGDIVINQDDEEENGDSTEELGSDNSAGVDDLFADEGEGDASVDLGGDEAGDLDGDFEESFGEGEEDFDESVDPGFVDEVNDLDSFGADAPELSQEEILDALRAVDQIVGTILETQGTPEDAEMTSDEQGFVLDQVDDLAAGSEVEDGFGGEEEFVEGEVIEDDDTAELDQIESSVLRVVTAGSDKKVPAFSRVYVSTEDFGGDKALVMSNVNSSLKGLKTPEEFDGSAVVDTVVISSGVSVGKDTPLDIGYLESKEISKWVKSSAENRKAWRFAFSSVSRGLGHKPADIKEFSAVYALASSVVEKLGSYKEAFSKVKPSTVRRVVSALSKRLALGTGLKVINSDYNGYRNYETWNAALWLNSDEGLYRTFSAYRQENPKGDYAGFLDYAGLHGQKTGDGVRWDSPKIDQGEVTKAITSGTIRGEKMGKKIVSATQVDGGEELVTEQDETPTGLKEKEMSESDPNIDDANRTEPHAEIGGGDPGKVVDVDNTGDMGSMEADTTAGEPFNGSGYSFSPSKGKVAALEIPIEKEKDTQVLELRHIGSSVYVLGKSYVASGAGRVSFTKGADAIKVLRSGTKPAPLKADVDGKVLQLKGSQNALYLRSSALLGVIAVEAPFMKGLKGDTYSVFSRAGVNMVNAEGKFLSMPKGPQTVIASSVSNKALRTGTLKVDIFSGVEAAYTTYLKSSLEAALKREAVLKENLAQSNAMLAQQRKQLMSRLESQRVMYQQQIASSVGSFDAFKSKVEAEEMEKAFIGSSAAIKQAEERSAALAQSNIDFLANVYF